MAALYPKPDYQRGNFHPKKQQQKHNGDQPAPHLALPAQVITAGLRVCSQTLPVARRALGSGSPPGQHGVHLLHEPAPCASTALSFGGCGPP